ncbi:aldo/keto reductase [Labrys monachus]|uniref:D-threo-aldose 1-dehydrogenase n=1 Tax=Labrys monachus TaxID=217067 RepID=A0ABU0FBP8_9HYPH|nr:aldo/keto reductase [Labrys monachus]MDQ0392037.1 D-threo-aldose 1-dehydrogenase [Labrys monachus]
MTVSALKTRRLGRAPVSVSELGLGTAPLGDLFDVVEDDEAEALLQAAWDGGIRYFDTSPWYGKGQAEHRVGRALYRRPRGEFVISSKVGRTLRRPLKPGPFERGDWLGGLEFDAVFDYSYDGIMRSFEDSLQRLGINRIDVLLIHDLDPWHFKLEAKVGAYMNQLYTSGWRALEELRDQGVIKGIGAGFNTMGTIPRYLDLFDIDFFLIAMRYTLLEQDVLDAEFPRCAERGVGIVIGGTYNSGILATGAVPGAMHNYAPAGPEILDKVARMEAVCRRHGVPLAAAALQFPLGHPLVASVIPGAISRRQVAQNLAAFAHPAPADLWAELKHEKLLREDAPVPA